MDKVEFENKWLNRIVRYQGNHYQIPKDVKYLVTAALYEWEDDEITIFAVMSEKWNPPANIDWITIRLAPAEICHLDDFEVVENSA